MARSIRATNLETRSARGKLPARKKPYWKLLDKNCYIGYYRGAKGGSWIARLHLGQSQYKEYVLGVADDVQDADGLKVFNFFQAQEKARAWFSEQIKIYEGTGTTGSPKTLSEAADEYLGWFKANRKSYAFTKQSIDLYIIPVFGKIELSKISTKRIQDWLNALISTAPRAKRGEDGKDKFRKVKIDQRKRKATANRQLTILKAILNYAYQHGYVGSDLPWRRVKPFKGVDIAQIRFLDKAQCTRLINASNEDFRKLVQAGLLTGCRYGELIKLKAGDYNSDNQSLFISESKSGKPRHVALNSDGVAFFSQFIAGKKSSDYIFIKNGSLWNKSHQAKPMQDACIRAKIEPAINFHILRHTYAAQLAMRGVSLQVIAAQLGHSDTRIAERHYAHLCPNYIADTIRANLPNLAEVVVSNVENLDAKRGTKNRKGK